MLRLQQKVNDRYANIPSGWARPARGAGEKKMKNPLSNEEIEAQSVELVRLSLTGDKKALSDLIELHQTFIFNVAWKMVHDINDANDLTQEVLVKVMTKLYQFEFKSKFRTWLYRIVTNEFLQAKRREGEKRFISFEDHAKKLDALPSPYISPEEEFELNEVADELKYQCMSGMLMCLTREQRLVYIIGDTFGVDHNVGAEVMNLSPGNFRVKLHRARTELHNFMQNKCGLVNTANPCRCKKKAKALVELGALDKDSMKFNVDFSSRIRDYVDSNYVDVSENFEHKYTELFREHPIRKRLNAETIVNDILKDEDLMKHFL